MCSWVCMYMYVWAYTFFSVLFCFACKCMSGVYDSSPHRSIYGCICRHRSCCYNFLFNISYNFLSGWTKCRTRAGDKKRKWKNEEKGEQKNVTQTTYEMKRNQTKRKLKYLAWALTKSCSLSLSLSLCVCVFFVCFPFVSYFIPVPHTSAKKNNNSRSPLWKSWFVSCIIAIMSGIESFSAARCTVLCKIIAKNACTQTQIQSLRTLSKVEIADTEHTKHNECQSM